MSNALSQSATEITLSVNGEASWDYVSSAIRAAERKAKGLTKERFELKRQTLISACCADYRSHFASVYGRTERLPSDVFEKIESAVDALIASKLAMIHTGNAVSVRRTFAHKPNDMKFVSRVTAVGEDEISLEEQHFACTLAIGQAVKRLTDLQAKKTPDYDREKEVKAQIMRLNLTREFIEGEIAHQNKLAAK
jgi:hypothetical protein